LEDIERASHKVIKMPPFNKKSVLLLCLFVFCLSGELIVGCRAVRGGDVGSGRGRRRHHAIATYRYEAVAEALRGM